MKKTKKTIKVLFISYEYTFGTFSGNGVLAASTVRGFLNDDSSDFDDDEDAMTTEILVVCARPTELEEELRMEKEDEEEDKGVLSVPVPKSKWGRLDKTCAHEEFATNVSEKQLEAIVKFRADVVLGVDWSSLEVYERIRKRYQEEEEDGWRRGEQRRGRRARPRSPGRRRATRARAGRWRGPAPRRRA